MCYVRKVDFVRAVTVASNRDCLSEVSTSLERLLRGELGVEQILSVVVYLGKTDIGTPENSCEVVQLIALGEVEVALHMQPDRSHTAAPHTWVVSAHRATGTGLDLKVDRQQGYTVDSHLNCMNFEEHRKIVVGTGTAVALWQTVADYTLFESEETRRADIGVDNPIDSSQRTTTAPEGVGESELHRTGLGHAAILCCSHCHCHMVCMLQHLILPAVLVGRADRQ